jgi:hypothetical protein
VVVEYKIAGMSLSLKINNNIGEVSVELMPKPILRLQNESIGRGVSAK